MISSDMSKQIFNILYQIWSKKQITNIIENCISIPEFSNDILIRCNYIIRWFLLEVFFDLELLNQIIILIIDEIRENNPTALDTLKIKIINTFIGEWH